MSSEEAVQEVRRIFTNNTVEQVRDYLSTITRGIQESDYRLKQIVGQSYRDLIAACDQVVGMEQTCRKLLQMQKQLHTEQQLTLSPQTPGDVLERGASSRRGVHPASSEATPVRCLFEAVVEGQIQGKEVRRNEADALTSVPCDRLVFQQRCIAIEGLLGSQQVQKAATVWHGLMDGLECEKRLAVKSLTTTVELQASIVSEGQGKQHEQWLLLLESYRSRIRQGIRELLRKDADDAAQRTVTSAIATKRSVRAGGNMREAQRHATADSLTMGDEFVTDALAHMAEAHAALEIIDTVHATIALKHLIELVAAMIKDELQLISKAINGGNKRKRGSESACGRTHTVNGLSGKMEWLRVALPLPIWLLDNAANSPLSTAWVPLPMEEAHGVGNNVITTSVTTTGSNHPAPSVAGRSNCKTSNGVIALHILQRTQQLFFHLVAYVASVLPRLYEPGRDVENRPLSQHHGGNDDDDDDCDDDGVNDRKDADGYGNYKRQQRSLQKLLTLRGRLVAQEQQQRQKQQEEDGSKDLVEVSDRMSRRMGGSFARGALSSSLLSAPEEIGDASLSESTSAMGIILPGGFNAPKRTHLRTMYIREVMRQVCGMQLLDPRLLQRRKPTKRFSGSDYKNLPATLEWKCEDVSKNLRIVQETVSQLLGCVADAGLLRSPHLVALQERLALQESTRMQKWLRENHRQNVLLFEDTLWTEMVHKTTERALVRAVGAGLRKADVIWNAILQSIRVEGSCHAYHQSPSPSIRPYVNMDAVTTTRPGTLSQLSQRLLSRSFFASRLIAAVHCSDGSRNESVFSSAIPEGRVRSSGKESATMNALLARAVAQCAWSHSKTASFGGKTQDTYQLYTNSPHNSISAISSMGCMSSDMFTAMMNGRKHVLALEEEEEMIFVDDDDDVVDDAENDEGGKEEEKGGDGNINVKKGNNVNHLEAKKKRIMSMFSLYSGGMETKIALNVDQAAVFERSVLLYMLQRIFDFERFCATAQTPVHNLITAWISGALGRVQDMMQREKEAYQQHLQQQQQENEGESFERCAAMMVFFNRLSLLVEVLLRVLETAPAVLNTAGALWEELRGTVIACHTPWVQLLRREWESGLCAAYKEAWAAVRVSTVDAVTPSLAARRYTLGYAAFWRHDSCHLPHQSQKREEEKGEQPVAYPIHLTPHVAELLFSLQHILYTVGTGQRLRETVLPIVLRELLDGTSSALLNVVLPSLVEDKTQINASANSNAGGDGNCPARNRQRGCVVNSAANNNTEGNKDDTNDDDEKDEAMLQLYFDVLFITGLFTSPDGASTSSTAAVLQAIESRVDPVTWSLTAPFVKSASARLLRATTLSFGSWCSTAAADVWNVAGSNAQSATENTQSHQSPLFNGAIATPKERDRFPLLPLATTAPSLIPSVGGTHSSLKEKGGSEGRGGAKSSWGATDVGSGDGSLPPAASAGGKEPVTPSFTATLLWGDGTTKGWMGSLW
ncbi:hypothetical protein MOQ_010065 [Trypanosoma cruzi marinkellei]|uniref:Conserved oligomeric Golgi complex subunit 1 n=1 Tax=Trypanosoma cruzi marinkellei TaxID=85056 RepID=K2NB36_TRYCR|nr:hypothetical protein MOQ_010065 [Trypanosoma cruzi marinkellei]